MYFVLFFLKKENGWDRAENHFFFPGFRRLGDNPAETEGERTKDPSVILFAGCLTA